MSYVWKSTHIRDSFEILMKEWFAINSIIIIIIIEFIAIRYGIIIIITFCIATEMKSAQNSVIKSLRYNFPFRDWINGINNSAQVLPISCILFNTMRISNRQQQQQQRKWRK